MNIAKTIKRTIKPLRRVSGRVLLAGRKHLPEILIITGVVTGGAAVVMTGIASTKVTAVVDDHKEQLEGVVEAAEAAGSDEKTIRKAKAKVYRSTAGKLTKLYGGAAAMGAVSVACTLSGTGIFKKRSAIATAAYTALSNEFDKYRERVTKRYGKEVDNEIIHGTELPDSNDSVVENAEEPVIDCRKKHNEDPYNAFTRIFYEGNNGYSKDPEQSKLYLISAQTLAQKKLERKGYLFLNEVFEMLGYPKTKIGHDYGWWDDGKGAFVDFGIFENPEFIACMSRECVLRFNVMGNVCEHNGDINW